jgi:CheY-like chemotaxis protein
MPETARAVQADDEGQAIDVLVVDDEPQVTELLADVLEGEGYRVAVASDGVEALAQVAALRPRLVLLDIMMPRLSGVEVMRRLQETDPAQPAIILMSAAVRPVDSPRHVPFLAKPFDLPDLLARVAHAL